MKNTRRKHVWHVHIQKLIKNLNKGQFKIGVKNKPRHRQLFKARKEELLHEFKRNY